MIDQKRIDLLFPVAESMGLQPRQVDDRGLISIQHQGREIHLFHKSSNPNTAMSTWLAENKYASRIIFERHKLPNIPFCLPTTPDDLQRFFAEHGKIIAKPLKGRKSQNIQLIKSEEEARRADVSGCILEKFISGQEVRLLVVEDQVRAVHHKMYDTEINNPDSVRRVSIEQDNWNPDLVEMARKASRAIGLIFTAVDFLVTDNREAYLLEINSAPGLDRFHNPDQGPAVNIVKMYLELVIKNNRPAEA